jgi:hypothetical protein
MVALKGMPMQERRKIKRRFLLYYSRIFDASGRILIGHLVDITREGLMLVSERPHEPNQVFQFKLELTTDVSDEPYLIFTARSVWCQPDIDPHFYNTGFKLLDIAPKDAEIIQRINDLYSFRDN